MNTEKPDLSHYLEALNRDVKANSDTFRDFSTYFLDEGISEFPVYMVSGAAIAIGRPFLNKKEHGTRWNYNVTFLEDLVNKGIVKQNKVEDFKEAYGDAYIRGCFFLIIGDSGSFVFVPYEN